MARSGYKLITFGYSVAGYLHWYITAQDANTNSSTVLVTYEIMNQSVNTPLIYSADSTWTLTVNGKSFSKKVPISTQADPETYVNIFYESIIIQHSGSGDEPLNWEIKFSGKLGLVGSSSTLKSRTVTGSDTLAYILRKATITSAPDIVTDEDLIAFHYDNPSGANAAVLEAGISLTNDDTAMFAPYRDIDKTSSIYTFVFTQDELNKLYTKLDKKIDSGIVLYLFLKSMISIADGTAVETVVERRTITLNFVNYKPTLNIQLRDLNTLSTNVTGDDQKFINQISTVYFNLRGIARKGATIKNMWIQNGDNLITMQQTGEFKPVTSDTFFAYIEDNRGYFQAYEIKWDKYINYIPLQCKVNHSAIDPDGTALIKMSGKYFDYNFGAVTNNITFEYSFTKEGETSPSKTATASPLFTSDFILDAEGNYTYNYIIDNLDYLSRYSLSLKVYDAIKTITYSDIVVLNPIPIFDWSGEDFAFYVPVTINSAEVPSIVEQGNSGMWTYRKWTDGTAECWGNKDFSVTFGTTAWGGMYTSGAISGSNVTFPTNLFLETPNIQASLLTRSIGGILMAPGGAGSNIASKSQTGVYEICRGNATNGNFTICYSAKGRWK